MSRKYIAYALLSGSIAVLAHCGSSDDSPLLADVDSGGNDASAGGDTSASGDAPIVQADSGPDGTVISSGGTSADAGPGGTTTSLTCGSVSCAIPAQACCVERAGKGAATFACVSGTGCPVADAGQQGDPPTALQCSGASNCAAGTVCCVEQNQNTTISSCKASCTGKDTAQLCDPNAAVSGCAGDAGNACSNDNIGDWGLPKTFATCGGKGN